jgi:hypothetical protein
MDQLGYWKFEPNTISIVSAKSGQRLSFKDKIETITMTDSERLSYSNGFLFEYEDEELCLPLFVWNSKNPGNWVLDYKKSAELWRVSNHIEADTPPFGLWKRVDTCVTDALQCWPENALTGIAPGTLHGIGGWVNGKWRQGFLRQWKAAHNREILSSDYPIQEIELINLETQPAHIWNFVEAPCAIFPDLDYLAQLPNGLRYLPPERPLSGYEKKISHLQRSDKKSVIFPAGLDSYRYESSAEYLPGAYFLYADEDVLFYFDGTAIKSVSRWAFKLPSNVTERHCRLGLRQKTHCDVKERESLPANLFSGKPRVLSLALSTKFRDALIDGFLSWTGTEHSPLDDPQHLEKLAARNARNVPSLENSGLDLGPRDAISITGGYLAGMYSHRFSQWASLKPEPIFYP